MTLDDSWAEHIDTAIGMATYKVLEGWIELGIVLGHDIPDIQTITR